MTPDARALAISRRHRQQLSAPDAITGLHCGLLLSSTLHLLYSAASASPAFSGPSSVKPLPRIHTHTLCIPAS